MGEFYVVGLIVPSRYKRSFKIYTLEDNGERTFVGLVSRTALVKLLRDQSPVADICKFLQTTIVDPFNS
jgi:hypothetical protein